jgi:hypothetical protein
MMPVPAEFPDRMATTPGSTLLRTAWMSVLPAMGGALVSERPGAAVVALTGRAADGVSSSLVATATPPPTRPPMRAATTATATNGPVRLVRAGAAAGALGADMGIVGAGGSHAGPGSLEGAVTGWSSAVGGVSEA